jgi:hypothetical protein
MTTFTPSDKCAQAEQHLMTLLLNRCRSRVCDSLPIRSECSTHATVGESLQHSDELLASASRTQATCTHAQCDAEAINSGEALGLNTLTLTTRLDGLVQLRWEEPLLDATGSPPASYRVWRRALAEGNWTLIAEVWALTYDDPVLNDRIDYAYEVTPVVP